MSASSVHFVNAKAVEPGDMLRQWGNWYSVIRAEVVGSRVKVFTECWGVMWYGISESVRVLSPVHPVRSISPDDVLAECELLASVTA